MVDWEIRGAIFNNCNCVYGCPCQFNALPSKGYCESIYFIRVDKGYFGETRLDSLNMAFAVAWPGAVHQGHGRMQPIIDERGDQAQRSALLSIMTAKETDPMATFFAIYTAMCDVVHEPIHTRITIDLDKNARTAMCSAEPVARAEGKPILNPVTGKEHRVGIVLPNGFEYGQNEVGRGWSTSDGPVALKLEDSYAHWCDLHFNRHGRIKAAA